MSVVVFYCLVDCILFCRHAIIGLEILFFLHKAKVVCSQFDNG